MENKVTILFSIYLFLYEKNTFFLFFFNIFLFFSIFFFFWNGRMALLVRVRTKTEWRVAKSKIVFDAVQSRGPAVSAGAAAAAADGGPNLVCE